MNKTTTYGKLVKIGLEIFPHDLEEMLRKTGHIPPGFIVKESSMEKTEVILVLEEPADPPNK